MPPVLHVLTAHVGSARWIALQRRCLGAFAPARTRVHLSVEDLDADPRPLLGDLDEVVLQTGEHAEKLNALAARVLEAGTGGEEDVLLFLDGDAIPVAKLKPLVERAAREDEVIAVRRDENLGDPQPHPSFCLLSAHRWRELGGDWRTGPTWANDAGERVSDVGARLWVALRERGIAWTPLLRTLDHGLHPLWFGLYGDIAYHHGAAFRTPISRWDNARGVSYSDRSNDGEGRVRAAEAVGAAVVERLEALPPHTILPALRSRELFAGLA